MTFTFTFPTSNSSSSMVALLIIQHCLTYFLSMTFESEIIPENLVENEVANNANIKIYVLIKWLLWHLVRPGPVYVSLICISRREHHHLIMSWSLLSTFIYSGWTFFFFHLENFVSLSTAQPSDHWKKKNWMYISEYNKTKASICFW